MAETTEIVANEFNVDVAVRTIRGRVCPVCGGKIIPSNRAVYQSAGDPADVYPLWECERCGHSEMVRRAEEPKKVHGAAAKKALPGEVAGARATPASAGKPSSVGMQADAKASGRAGAKRAMPPDVKKMLEVMKRTAPKIES